LLYLKNLILTLLYFKIFYIAKKSKNYIMRRVIYTLIFINLFFWVYSQQNLKEFYSVRTGDDLLVCYRIEREIYSETNGAYGLMIKTPFAYTSFALGWKSGVGLWDAGNYEIAYRVYQNKTGWSDWKYSDGHYNPKDTKDNFYKSDLMFGFNEFEHDSVEFYIYPPESDYITEVYLILLNVKPTSELNFKSGEEELNGTKSCPEFPVIIPRSSWCGSYQDCLYPTYTPTYLTSCTHTVIHHGASPDSYTDGAAVVRSYWNYHVNSNGWSDIGYNYLFDKYGNFYQGRYNPNLPNQDVKGAHAGYSNSYSIGLNFLGNSDAPGTAPTTPQLQKCEEFLAWWYDHKSYDPLSSASILNQAGTQWINLPRICGHRDVNPGGTTCPGETLYALLPNIKTQTKQIIDDCSTPTDNIPPTTEISKSRKWYNSDFLVNFSDADNVGGTGVKHSFYQVMDYNGTEWRANSSHGFFNDNFTSVIHPEWTIVSGTWSISGGRLLQSNQSLVNTNIYANVTQQSGNIYLYHWQMKISGTGTNRRAGMHFFCSDPTADGRGNSYMVYLRADNNTVQIYKYVNNSYSSGGGYYVTQNFTINANQWYDVKVLLNTNTGKIDVYVDNILAATTTDTSPFTAGTAISLRAGECLAEYDDVKVYVSRSTNVNVTAGLNSSKEIRYQSVSSSQESGRIRTLLIDNNNNWSTSYAENIFTDFTNPQTSFNVNGEWQTANFQINFNDSDELSGIEKRFYSVSDFNGTKWTANAERGFAYNNFDSEIGAEWTQQVGTWSISNGALVQTNESEGNSNIWAYLKQNLSNRYLYEFDLKIEGSGTNRRGGFHYFASDPTQTNRGNGYFIWFRHTSQQLEFYKVTDNVFSLEKYYNISLNLGQWYNIKLVYDRITGEHYVYMDNVLVGEYKDENPYQTGDYVSFRSGNSLMSVDNFRVFRTRYPDVTISMGDFNSDIRYQSPNSTSYSAKIYSIVSDSAKNISAIVQQSIKTDWTAPLMVATVNDGLEADIDTTYVLNSISANWTSSSDLQSGIQAYYYAVGTTPGGTELINWTNNGLNLSFTNNSVSLIPGTMYYVSVKVLNNAGLYSNVRTSDGVRALNPPVVPDCPSNYSVCISEPAFALSGASPVGGTYSGTGVAGGVFNPSVAGVGVHTITYTLETENCQFSITVNPLPTVSCPANIYKQITDPEFTLAGASPVGGQYSINSNVITTFNPSTYGVGDYIIQYSYTNPTTLCSNTCSFMVSVYQPDVVECPASFSICSDVNSVILQGGTPPGGVYSGTGVVDGVFYPAVSGIGQSLITYTYNTQSCQFYINVVNPPTVNCPGNLVMNVNDSPLNLSDLSVSPSGGVFTINGVSVSNFDPGIYGVGNYTVTYTYTDANSCSASCNFTIQVEPAVQCPANVYVCENGNSFTLSGATPVGGTYSINGNTITSFNPSQYGVGSYTVIYQTQTGTCSYEIVVNAIPEVNCPSNISIAINSASFTLSGAYPQGGTYFYNGIEISMFDPAQAGIGQHEITYFYSDLCENSCSFIIDVYEPVTVICPEGFSVCKNSEPVVLTGASPEGGVYSGNGVVSGVFNPDAVNPGYHQITYTLGNFSCSFNVLVYPIPVVECPENLLVSYYGGVFELTGGTPEGGWYMFNNEIVTQFDPLVAGIGIHEIYYYYQNPNTGCTGNCIFTIEVYPAVNINEYGAAVLIYPNPFDTNIKIENAYSDGYEKLSITDITGRIVLEKEIQTDNMTIESPDLSSGTYILKISGKNKNHILHKIIKK
jgi:hypothetical protein